MLFARRWTADASEAEDWVQEAFLRFWPTRQGVQDPVAYLYQCVRRVAIDAARGQRARGRREQAAYARRPTASPFHCTVEQEERRQRIEAALAGLPPEQAEVVTLKIWSELTFAQIGEVTSAAPGTVASRYRYALNHMRAALKEGSSR